MARKKTNKSISEPISHVEPISNIEDYDFDYSDPEYPVANSGSAWGEGKVVQYENPSDGAWSFMTVRGGEGQATGDTPNLARNAAYNAASANAVLPKKYPQGEYSHNRSQGIKDRANDPKRVFKIDSRIFDGN